MCFLYILDRRKGRNVFEFESETDETKQSMLKDKFHCLMIPRCAFSVLDAVLKRAVSGAVP